VQVECGDIGGLGFQDMIAIALAKADRAHVTLGVAVEHGPVSVSSADADDRHKYRAQAAGMIGAGFRLYPNP
jgi:hypothetical protein